MKDVAISEFRATCGKILSQVQRTGKPIRIVRFGEPIAVVFPVPARKPSKRWLGSMKGTAQILGDIVGPTGTWEDWEAGR